MHAMRKNRTGPGRIVSVYESFKNTGIIYIGLTEEVYGVGRAAPCENRGFRTPPRAWTRPDHTGRGEAKRISVKQQGRPL